MVEWSSLTDTQGPGLGCWWLDLRTSSTGKVHGIQSSWLAQVAGGGRPRFFGEFLRAVKLSKSIYTVVKVDGDGHFQKVAICKGANTWEWLAISFRSVVLFRSVGYVSVPALKVTGDRFSTRQVTPGELKGTNKNTPRVGRAIGKSIYPYITCDRMGGPDMIC